MSFYFGSASIQMAQKQNGIKQQAYRHIIMKLSTANSCNTKKSDPFTKLTESDISKYRMGEE